MPRLARAAGAVGLVLAALVLALGGLGPEPTLWLLPLLLLVVPLLLGRYAGEALIETCRARRARAPRRAAGPAVGIRHGQTARLSGGRLVARAHGQRGPPPALRLA